MRRHQRGFGLIELLIALALGLIIVLGVVQIFIAAKNTYVSQNSAAAMQEDARFVLSKMIQEIRMVGMFGCLGTITDSSSAGDFNAAQISADQLGQRQPETDAGHRRYRQRRRHADLDGAFRLPQQRHGVYRVYAPRRAGRLPFRSGD